MAARKKAKTKAKARTKKKAAKKAKSSKPSRKNRIRAKTKPASRSSGRKPPRSVSAGQSGDLQGVSTMERADSESVDELLEEGNTFEAGVVAGVERADDAEGKEVRTRQFPEDDVPEEYLDKD